MAESQENAKEYPAIRFNGFRDAWVQRELSDGYRKIRNAFVGTATPFYVESGHFYLESNNVKNGQLNFNSKVFINDEFYQKQIDQLLNAGDLVMVQSGHVGHTAVIPQELDGTAAHALIMFKNNDGSFDSGFVNQYFQTVRAKNAISIITTGNTIKHILASDMQKMELMVPSVDEQRKISLLLQLLDNLIAANQRKGDKLAEVKKLLLQKMFVSKGQEVPDVRFDGFTATWKQLKLGEVYQFKQGTQVPVENQYTVKKEGMQRFIRIVDLTSSNETPRYITDNSDNVISKSDLFMVRYGAVGVIGLGYEGVIANNLFRLIPKDDLDEKFSFQQLTGEKDKIISLSSSTTMPALNFTTLKKLPFSKPSIEEQKKIGTLLTGLDELISANYRKGEKLVEIKKLLLQQMFV